jgi:hypothetical protein
MNKKPSTEVFTLIDKIITDYDLEKDLLDKNPDLKKRLLASYNLMGKMAVKVLFEKKLESQNKKNPSRDIFASFIIYDIIKKLLNQEITAPQIKDVLKNSLLLSSEKSEEISQKILNSEYLKKEMSGEYKETEEINDENIKFPLKKGGLSQELQ